MTVANVDPPVRERVAVAAYTQPVPADATVLTARQGRAPLVARRQHHVPLEPTVNHVRM